MEMPHQFQKNITKAKKNVFKHIDRPSMAVFKLNWTSALKERI